MVVNHPYSSGTIWVSDPGYNQWGRYTFPYEFNIPGAVITRIEGTCTYGNAHVLNYAYFYFGSDLNGGSSITVAGGSGFTQNFVITPNVNSSQSGLYKSGARATSGVSIQLVLDASDNSGSALIYSLDGITYQPVPEDGIITAPVISQGTNVVRVWVEDEAGNIARTSVLIWKI